MATRSDFAVVRVDAHFGDNAGDISSGLPFVGNQKSVNFTIDGVPSGKGYILINSFDVDSQSHQVQINGKNLPGADLVTKASNNRWQTRMRDIPSGVLKQGGNTLTIKRASGGDNFLITETVVNWRE